jgi:hypothetical protein
MYDPGRRQVASVWTKVSDEDEFLRCQSTSHIYARVRRSRRVIIYLCGLTSMIAKYNADVEQPSVRAVSLNFEVPLKMVEVALVTQRI